jgi:hypothetical protein
MCNFKNPFAEYNANSLSWEQISEFFAEPFDFFDIRDSDIKRENSSIVFIGGRGTGKTMLLKQFSYNVQKISLQDQTSFLEKVRKDGYIGIYFRVDNPLLKSLDSFSIYSKEPDFAERVFTHYFELTVYKDYLEIIKIFLLDSGLKNGDKNYSNILRELIDLLNYSDITIISDIDDLLSLVVDQINYIWKYQSEKAIDINGTLNFVPRCGMKLQGRLTNEFLRTSVMKYFGLNDISVLLLIDEFEDFSEKQQQVLNTAMRFTKDYGARFRIGMRPRGFKTYGTLDNTDFIKEGRDYRKVEFGFPFIKKGPENYLNLVKKIANKRLAVTPHFHNKNIVEILGKSENLEEEAKDITRGKSKHVEEYLKLINNNRKDVLTIDDLSLLRDENPLYEMENLRLLLKGETLEYVTKAFLDYKNGVESEEQKKYSNDYDKKYKLSFVFILCTIYHVEKKKYYSFADYCQLSSGIIGCFIELCHRAIDIAYFKERKNLFEGYISKEVQTDAAYACAQSERDNIQRIVNYGNKIKTFIDNIGNAFSYIHKDVYIRYPETNLFPVVLDLLTAENKEIIKTACTWSLLIEKPNTQDTKAKSQKQDIYILNRLLAPVYKISYRTRGGLNPISVNNQYFENTFDPMTVLSSKTNNINENENSQMTLFSQLGYSENESNMDEWEE